MSSLLLVAGSTLRVSTPLIFTALGGLCSERSGVINIALEGLMMMGALAAAIATQMTHSPEVGLIAAVLAGVAMSLIYGLFVIPFRANQVVAGTAINLLAAGVAPFVCKILYGVTGSTPALELGERFAYAPTVLAAICVVLVWAWLNFTASGLWLRFAGEHPQALDAAGVRVNRVRWLGVALSGVFAGLGGASLSIYLSSSFARGMTGGRGFMALAALIFGKWRPIPAALACLLFGFADAMQIRLQGVVVWGTQPVPVQFIQILPYVVTILVLAGVVGQSRAPRALGTPFLQK